MVEPPLPDDLAGAVVDCEEPPALLREVEARRRSRAGTRAAWPALNVQRSRNGGLILKSEEVCVRWTRNIRRPGEAQDDATGPRCFGSLRLLRRHELLGRRAALVLDRRLLVEPDAGQETGGPRWRPRSPRSRRTGCRSRPAHHHERGVAPAGDLDHEGVAARVAGARSRRMRTPGEPDAAAKIATSSAERPSRPGRRTPPEAEAPDHLGRDVDIANPDVERPGRPAAVAGRVDGSDREPVRPTAPSFGDQTIAPFRRSAVLISWRPPTSNSALTGSGGSGS